MLLRGYSLIDEVLTGTMSLLFPERCAGCDRIDVAGFCRDCLRHLDRLDPECCCSRCGAWLIQDASDNGSGCKECRRRKPRFKRAAAAYTYTGPLVRAMIQWKYRNQRNLSGLMSGLLVDWVAENSPKWWEKIEVVVPAPHHPKTVKARGFSPPEELSKPVSEAFVLGYAPRVLFKVKETPPQQRLSEEERQRNVVNAMRVFDGELIEGKRVLVVDDVMTTGATLNECARALMEGGAKEVYGLVLAKQSGGEK